MAEQHILSILRVRPGAKVTLGPDDRLLYMRSEDDLSLGGEWHTFAFLRAPSASDGSAGAS